MDRMDDLLLEALKPALTPDPVVNEKILRLQKKKMGGFMTENAPDDQDEGRRKSDIGDENSISGPASMAERNRRWRKWMPAAAVLAAFILIPTAVKAYGEYRNYRLRFSESMEDTEIEEVYHLLNDAETEVWGGYNRPLDSGENSRYKELEASYEEGSMLPVEKLAYIEEPEDYRGEAPALCKKDLIYYLPERELTDEELLTIIEDQHKIMYGLQKYTSGYFGDEGWKERMKALTDEELDQIYFDYCYSDEDVGGGTSRRLSDEEYRHMKELETRYEEENYFPVNNILIIQHPGDYTGAGVALCRDDSRFYVPEGALDDEEMLEIIDFHHKVSYMFHRIQEEISMGIRDGWPQIIRE